MQNLVIFLCCVIIFSQKISVNITVKYFVINIFISKWLQRALTRPYRNHTIVYACTGSRKNEKKFYTKVGSIYRVTTIPYSRRRSPDMSGVGTGGDGGGGEGGRLPPRSTTPRRSTRQRSTVAQSSARCLRSRARP